MSFGYRKRHSTVSPLARITDFKTRSFYLRKHRKVILDNEKTYYTIRLNGLLYKLISPHLADYLLSFLKSYSESRNLTVHLNDYLSLKTYNLMSSSRCCTIDYIIFPLHFCHAKPSAHSPRLTRRRHCPSVSVLILSHADSVAP